MSSVISPSLTRFKKEITMDQLVQILKVMMPQDERQGDIVRHKGYRFRPSTRTYLGASFVETFQSGKNLICGPLDDIDSIFSRAFEA
jgi:hypothetical protein